MSGKIFHSLSFQISDLEAEKSSAEQVLTSRLFSPISMGATSELHIFQLEWEHEPLQADPALDMNFQQAR